MLYPNRSLQTQPILLVALAQRYGGSEGRVLDLAKLFQGKVDYAVVTLQDSPLHRRLQSAHLSVVPFRYSRADPRLLSAILHLIRQDGYKVIDAHNPQSQWWGLWAGKLAGAPVLVSTVHLAYGRVQKDSIRGWLYEQVLRWNRRWGCHFVTVSDSIRQYLTGLGVKEVALIHNAIDVEGMSAGIADFSWRSELGWEESNFVVTMVGRLEPQKGYPFLIEAMQLAVKRCPSLRCLVVGDGRLRAELEQKVADLGLSAHLHFAGFRSDVPALLRTSDAFCLSSLAEGLPYALLEAAAHRLPLLVTQVDGMAELLTHRQNAFLVPPSNVQALADGLCWLVEHPAEAKQLGENGYSLIRSRFNPAQMVAETLAVYNR